MLVVVVVESLALALGLGLVFILLSMMVRGWMGIWIKLKAGEEVWVVLDEKMWEEWGGGYSWTGGIGGLVWGRREGDGLDCVVRDSRPDQAH